MNRLVLSLCLLAFGPYAAMAEDKAKDSWNADIERIVNELGKRSMSNTAPPSNGTTVPGPKASVRRPKIPFHSSHNFHREWMALRAGTGLGHARGASQEDSILARIATYGSGNMASNPRVQFAAYTPYTGLINPSSTCVPPPYTAGTCEFSQQLQSTPFILSQYQAQIASLNWAPSPEISYDIDSMSHSCLECHDGSLGPDEPVVFQGVPSANPSDYERRDHPIGMNYQYSSLSPALRKKDQLPSNMLFIESKVGCLTCHDPLNNTVQNNLVISNLCSALCFACHIK